MFIVVEIFLRKLENKSAQEVVKNLVGIKKEFDDLNKPIKSIVTDLGLEYNNTNILIGCFIH